MKKSQIKRCVPFAIPALTVGIFFLDWLTPLGVVDWVLYFIPLLLSFYAQDKYSPLLLALIFSALTVAGFFLSPPGLGIGIALVNLALGLGTLWTAAFLVAQLQRAMNETRRMLAIVEQSPVSVFLTDLAGNISYVNPRFTEVTGYAFEEVAGKNPRILKSGHTPPEAYQRMWETLASGKEWRGTFHNRKKDGSLYWSSAIISQVFNLSGQPTHFLGIGDDISERKRVEDALLESELRYRSLFANMLNGYAYCRMLFEDERPCDFIYLEVNAAFEKLTGLKNAAGRKATEVIPGIRESDPEIFAVYGRVARTGAPEQVELFVQGMQMWFSISVYSPAKDHFVAVFDVITDRKNAEAALRESEERFREMVEGADVAVFLTLDMKFTYLNPAALRLFGAQRAGQLLGQPVVSVIHPDSLEIVHKHAAMIYNGVRDRGPGHEVVYIRLDGTAISTEVSASPFSYRGQRGAAVFVQDITERKRVQTALRESEERFRQIAESIEDVFWVLDPAMSRVIYVSPAYEKIWGQPCQRVYDEPGSWLEAVHPEDRERVRRAIERQLVPGGYNEDYRVVRPDGQIRWIHDTAFPVRGAAGQWQRVVGVARDITDSRQLEEQYRQSQKMEAIGQLAGGVAHDFNNILGAMLMQIELAEMIENVSGEIHDSLKEIRTYAERAANLTRQLLLFSRRQVMQPCDLDLNEVVTNLAKMLQRMIGEDVRLQLHLNPAPLMTHSDAGMLDQVLMNLAVNSRDAMPKGGRLTIETSEKIVEESGVAAETERVPGRYVCLRVSDTGCGIPPEVLPRIFEPFFTTKEAGRGTGLGLATVFGIVKQHCGFLDVESTPGGGTTFQILLPNGVAGPNAQAQAVARPKPCGGSETILLVEDEPALRVLTCALLKRHGYQVFSASQGNEALQLWREHRGAIALLVTDLVMPNGLNGQELARQMQTDQPQLKVLLMSGYSGQIAGQELHLHRGENFLQKPFDSDQLLRTIRQCLDDRENIRSDRPLPADAGASLLEPPVPA